VHDLREAWLVADDEAPAKRIATETRNSARHKQFAFSLQQSNCIAGKAALERLEKTRVTHLSRHGFGKIGYRAG
jgi:hypothetical protein